MLLFFYKKVTSQQQHKQEHIKTLARAGNRTRDLSHRSLESYVLATESTERIDCSQAFLTFFPFITFILNFLIKVKRCPEP